MKYARTTAMRTVVVISALALCVLLLGTIAVHSEAQQTSSVTGAIPVYASEGGYVSYQVEGGFIAFLDGVNGSIVYTVTRVYGNGTMEVNFNATISEGSEVPTTSSVYNYTDSVTSPRIFPAVPQANLTKQLIFENTTISYKGAAETVVPAGTFNTYEYEGAAANGTTFTFWFDKGTGIAVEMASSDGSAVQLAQSNILSPSVEPNSSAASLPYIETFIAAFAISAVMFGGVWKYYSLKNRRNYEAAKRSQGGTNILPEDKSGGGTAKKKSAEENG